MQRKDARIERITEERNTLIEKRDRRLDYQNYELRKKNARRMNSN